MGGLLGGDRWDVGMPRELWTRETIPSPCHTELVKGVLGLPTHKKKMDKRGGRWPWCHPDRAVSSKCYEGLTMNRQRTPFRL